MLKTEDGFDIFEGYGDLFSVLTKGSWEQRRTRPIHAERYPLWKHFKTKEALEKYVLLHRPCLSVHDLLGHPTLSYIMKAHEDGTLNELFLELAKQKQP